MGFICALCLAGSRPASCSKQAAAAPSCSASCSKQVAASLTPVRPSRVPALDPTPWIPCNSFISIEASETHQDRVMGHQQSRPSAPPPGPPPPPPPPSSSSSSSSSAPASISETASISEAVTDVRSVVAAGKVLSVEELLDVLKVARDSMVAPFGSRGAATDSLADHLTDLVTNEVQARYFSSCSPKRRLPSRTSTARTSP